MSLPKILIIGHGKHGKDTVAEYFRDRYNYKFASSSMFVAERAIWPHWGCAVYPDIVEMFKDRENHRTLWGQMISAYNIPNAARTAQEMLSEGNDMYVGMRRKREVERNVELGTFDHILWVDRSLHVPDEPKESMELVPEDSTYIIDNNRDIPHMQREVDKFCRIHSIS